MLKLRMKGILCTICEHVNAPLRLTGYRLDNPWEIVENNPFADAAASEAVGPPKTLILLACNLFCSLTDVRM